MYLIDPSMVVPEGHYVTEQAARSSGVLYLPGCSLVMSRRQANAIEYDRAVGMYSPL